MKKRLSLIALTALFVAAAMLMSSCMILTEAIKDYRRAVESALSEVTDTADTDAVEPGGSGGGIRRPDVEGETSTPLMWHVVSPNGGELYLLGSMHAGLEDMCLFPDEIYGAFDYCDALAVECDVIALEDDEAASMQAIMLLRYTDGTSISDHLDRETYEKAKRVLERFDYYEDYLDAYIPILWSDIIEELLTEQTPYQYDNGVDRYFLKEAKRLGKTVLEVENYLDTYRAEAAMSAPTQAILLRDTADDEYISSYEDGLADLYRVWKRGDLDEVNEALVGDGDEDLSEYTAEEIAAYEEYNKMILADRNKIMIEKADRYLREARKVFYVVGLAHMVGEDGIVAGLTALGYTVEQVSYAG